MFIGCHLSSSRGFLAMGEEALTIDANTFQFFTRNPRGSRAKKMDPADAAALAQLLSEREFGPLVAHAPYTMNPCSANPSVRDFARAAMADDLWRLSHIPGQTYNFHPGSHTGQGVEEGIRLIVEVLDEVIREEESTKVLLETMAGQGTEIGWRFEELGEILRRAKHGDNMGVCLDTCHVWAAGYDIVNDLDGVLEAFDREIGLHRLFAIHLNDSMGPLGNRKDRHAKIGEGEIGWDAFVRLVSHPVLEGLPFVLETPNDLDGYAKEIRALRAAREDTSASKPH